MRIDKFLKNSRIIKRRTVAKESCDQGRVIINGKIAKPGDEVEVGDIVEIKFGQGIMKIEVLSVQNNVSRDNSKEVFKVL
ncbi:MULTISPECIES: RNA-binding S4 domain-containing protein [Tissierellales]|jgi:ribosomal 50S subunit-recycling heat shock protein|uniref:RQC P-site tRNA stabilizing factor n=1 Tax=Acidilutibacter cellobiosedens TaxID=2507161 RepID=A0A410QFB7_9FIRM|nr:MULTISPECIES: RNA-binding S4 domain-containing protein [Tissierellales]MBE6082230.1 RNA-binding S4 domain-containing protein [Tissierellaceae bacterium]QAT62763.1 RNA-binding S4 domain-containing protein [Acidilutibacter cellobiosedens]SCL95436.1 23S rRNA pseudouridine synthase F [Sporanaerobacter sp. PP17-6a]